MYAREASIYQDILLRFATWRQKCIVKGDICTYGIRITILKKFIKYTLISP